MRPVVIQTMWRTGGTYLAFMLRERNPVALFYEPLHEDYSRFARADWDRRANSGGNPSLGHPRKSFHYLTDYPFLDDAGVVGHRPEFAFERFALGPDDAAPELSAYLAGLVAYAESVGRRALFKFCRGFLRQAAAARAIDPATVYLARSAAGMEGSYARVGGPYFYSAYLRIVANNRAHPIFAGVYEALARSYPDYAAADPALLSSDALAGTVPPEARHDVLLYFWALALAEQSDGRALILDANGFADQPRATAEALGRHTGLDVDFSDAVPLDRGSDEVLRFVRPDIFGRLLRESLAGRALDASGCPEPIARQFDALAVEA